MADDRSFVRILFAFQRLNGRLPQYAYRHVDTLCARSTSCVYVVLILYASIRAMMFGRHRREVRVIRVMVIFMNVKYTLYLGVVNQAK